jgi:protein-tyrosine-phosphatase
MSMFIDMIWGGGAMAHRPFNVLFLCKSNSARSIMAEAIIGRVGEGRFVGYSAGSHPSGEVHPFALNLLLRKNYDVATMRSKSWDEFGAADAPELDFVFTVCDKTVNEPCPVWPGQPMNAHWPVPDPVSFVGDDAQKALAFADAYRMLFNRISIFAALPVRELDRISLQQRLDQIGLEMGHASDPGEGQAA